MDVIVDQESMIISCIDKMKEFLQPTKNIMHQIDLQASKSRNQWIQQERCQRFKGFENAMRKRYSETLRTKQLKKENG